jgi:hypothetical protein
MSAALRLPAHPRLWGLQSPQADFFGALNLCCVRLDFIADRPHRFPMSQKIETLGGF